MCLSEDVKRLRIKIKKDRINHDEIIQLAEDLDVKYDARRKYTAPSK